MNRTYWLLLLAAMVAVSNCGSGGGGSSSGPATVTIDVSGGAATAATTGTLGGAGGRLNLYGYDSVDVSPDGSVLIQFVVPSMAAEFGTYKVTVTTDKTVNENNVGDPTAGVLYKSSGILYEANGNGDPNDDPPVTGLEVAAGATLYEDSSLGTLAVNNDIIIAGNISLAKSTLDDITLESSYGSIWIKATGVITNEDSNQGGGNILLTASGDIIMEGSIIASGRSGAPEGWSVDITPGYPDGNTWVTGSIITSGADNVTTGPGGNAGGISIISISDTLVDATLTSNGGAGSAGTGGNANTIKINAGNVSLGSGDLLATGIFNAKGGASTGGNGGPGGEIELYNNSPDQGMLMEVNAVLGVSGGNATGEGSSGGAGGVVNITQDSGPINFTGSIDVRGGQGESAGGLGGDLNADANEIGEALNIRGITALYALGGTGDTGGAGNPVNAVTIQTVGGDITISSDIHADGGNGVATGGDGGRIGYRTLNFDFTGMVTYSGGTGTVAGTVGVFEAF
jgi:hypothetical protein